ncbi:MAG: class Ib ribonucleoside-diphosphate reductase assembly flavoprotein NrdI [Yaniella sp.]|uniref:class Ib ribonucleoside-diphosphate reductase assembly flavoprotein NrdI n=1 Tax=Yaniella sp. TaxID=2773929 RepID=UPI00264785E9|nr:class Ib ribonucleoside-diphosphate reductase assembly flavoprotein NrdI [Yaniella sp.]MDN5704510.1 class Ib ribonucleoside-diphosphate reductase assembly flavoprotein NrdI [Yaniella sp.]MDN5732289.1 class Ib ribonucleoside-diphosphate reductase assembly flavoprotein NrdI [Yaniella sp.]MDN5743003.1 class Ib ribonucleoside-diphosphate reductase assembly flavoprotein NrdI [Yaniella sp.]MDN5815527.1 class Ib ribonucleoside-diphosphate reductase assembly flavoprotein NrdI [Yaniella sp.]MDN58187
MSKSTTSRQKLPVQEISAEHSPDLVYFSSVSENTKRFVDRLNRPAIRIPLRPRVEGPIRVNQPFVLVVPTYGGGEPSTAVPKQVIAFLNDPQNRDLLRGVITAGNTNFGAHYCLAGPVISQKCQVPELYRFELLGTSHDTERVTEGLRDFWSKLATAEPTTV